MNSNLNIHQKSIQPVKPPIPPVVSSVNLENNLTRASQLIQDESSGAYHRFILKELLTNLKLLKLSHEKGQSREFLDKFYAFYEFNQNRR